MFLNEYLKDGFDKNIRLSKELLGVTKRYNDYLKSPKELISNIDDFVNLTEKISELTSEIKKTTKGLELTFELQKTYVKLLMGGRK
jgi:5-bromo-4-chloroindolyl phosphate hydrolysis protein